MASFVEKERWVGNAFCSSSNTRLSEKRVVTRSQSDDIITLVIGQLAVLPFSCLPLSQYPALIL